MIFAAVASAAVGEPVGIRSAGPRESPALVGIDWGFQSDTCLTNAEDCQPPTASRVDGHGQRKPLDTTLSTNSGAEGHRFESCIARR